MAQTATATTSGASPLLSINGGNYQGYCVEYYNSVPTAGDTYNWDTTVEDINLFGVTACLQGHSSYGTSAVQRAVWYFTDNVDPPAGHDAWIIIDRVNNGVYVDQCASEWYPSDAGEQDMMTHNDPYCVDPPQPPNPWTGNCGDGKKVDIYGDGCSGGNASTTIPNSGNVYKVAVEVVYKGCDPGGSVTITKNGTTLQIPKVATTGTSSGVYVYRGEFLGSASSVSTNSACGGCTTGDGLQSIVVYAHRQTNEEITSSGIYTEIDTYCDLQTVNLPIPTHTTDRDVELCLPISELTNDGRHLKITVTGGGATNTIYINGPDLGCCLNIPCITISGVAGSASSLTLTLDSRASSDNVTPHDCGQSYVIAGYATLNLSCNECDDSDFHPGSISGNALGCGPFNPPVLPTGTNHPASGCDGGTIVYQWQRKDASTNWVWQDITGAISSTWDPPYMTESSWVRRGAACDPCGSFQYTNVIDIHVVPNYTDGGEIADDEFNCGPYNPSNIISVHDPSPYYDFYDDLNEIKWEKRTPGGNWSVIPGETNLTYDPGQITTTTEYRRCSRVEPCTEWICSNIVIKEVGTEPTNFDPGTIGDGASFCDGGDAGKIVGSVPTGCDDGTIEYQWQFKGVATNGSWQDVNGATSQNWDPPFQNSSIWVRRAARCAPCGSFEYSNVIDIHISNNYTSGGEISQDQCACGPFDPSVITVTGPKGGTVTWDGFLNSKWQVMPEGGTWTDIPGQVDEGTNTPEVPNTYNPGPITVTTKYRKCFRILPCTEWICSDEAIMEVVPEPVAVDDHETICLNETTTIDVAANDSHNDYNTSYQIITQPNGGTASMNTDGSLTYTSPNACGTQTIVYEVCNDANNCSIDCCDQGTVTITVEDTENPSLHGVPVDITVQCDDIPAPPTVTASDNCDTDPQVSYDESSTQTNNGSCNDAEYLVSRTWTALDVCGNSHSEHQVITVIDTSDPIVSCNPDDDVIECVAGQLNQLATAWNDANMAKLENCSSDTCGDVVVSSDFSVSNISDECGGSGETTVTYTITDQCGNNVTKDATLTFEDTTPPTIPCDLINEVHECSGPAGNESAAADWNAANIAAIEACGADDCSANNTVTSDYSFGDLSNECGSTGTMTVTFTLTDDCGLSTTKDATFTVEDTTDPIVTCIPDNETYECSGTGANQSAADAWNAANILKLNGCSSDACASVTVTSDYSFGNLDGGCGGVGSIDVVYTIEDECGHSVTETATFTIEDNTNPVVTCDPDNETHECTGDSSNESVANSWNAANIAKLEACSSDACGDITVTSDYNYNNLSDECGDSGSIPVTYTITDECGFEVTKSATFTVEDTTSPTIDVDASDLTVECNGSGNDSELQNWLDSSGGASSSDICGNVTWTNDYASLNGDCANSGSVTVTFTATDDCDNVSTTSATFTIEDTTNPVIDIQPSDMVVECDGNGNNGDIQAWLDSNGGSGQASDVCGDVTWTNNYTSLSVDCGATGTDEIIFTVTDECGNTTTATATFTIEDTTSPEVTLEAQDQTVECDGSGNQAELQAWLNDNGGATASDICGTISWENDFTSLSDDCGATGSASVIFTVTDDCGNESTTSATFIIEDTTDPTITTASDEVVECDGNGNQAELQAWLDNNGGATAEDICGSVTWTNDISPLTDECGATGEVTVTFTATDDCGNESTASATFIIEDTTSPSINTEAADAVVECDGAGNTAELQAWLDSNGGAEATDACGSFTWVNDYGQLTDDCAATGTVTVTFTVTDECGNESQTTADFTIEDTTPPVPVCQDITVQLDGNCEISITPEDIDNGSTDICGDIASISIDTENFNCAADEGDNTVVLTVTDECGNEATCTANVRVERFDLALRTVLAPREDERVYPGEDITFKIEVHNQGSLAASNIQITDYIPAGLTLNDSDWSGGGSTATITLPGTLQPGDMTMVEITFTVSSTSPGQIINEAEISGADAPNGFNSVDVDSTPDTNQNNDGGGEVNTPNDDEINEGCCSIDGDDEDDSDPEDITVEVFDLALIKVMAAGQDTRVYPGEDVTFTIEVHNQGTIPASGIEVTDYIPAGLTLNDGAWSGGGSTATINLPGTLAPGASTTVDITFTVDATSTATNIVNRAEISASVDDLGDDAPDLDSVEDSNQGNDAGGVVNGGSDDQLDGNGTDDEDDADPEDIDVEIFDLALRKTLAAGEDARVYPGQEITFDIEVFNQGTVPASNIEILDTPPNGLTPNGPTTIIIPGPIAPGSSAVVQITMTVDDNVTPGLADNIAEIQSSEDDLGDSPNDNDSTEDSNPTNDPTTDNEIDNGSGDEDDNDLETVDIQIFDLALIKVLAAGEDDRVYPGETITFTIEVFNQGSVPASNISIEDYVPAGLTPTGATSLNIPGPLAPGASTTLDISFTVDATNTGGQIINVAEISGAEDDLGDATVPDIDSDPDTNQGNDAGGVVNGPSDDQTNGNGTDDEDDADPEDVTVEIFDLALRKTLAAGEDATVYPGETITFTIEVFNQGTVPAENVVLTDYVPAGLTAIGATTLTIAGPIAPGSSTTVDVSFTVDPASSAATLENEAEIASAEDDLGNNPTDNDSTPDTNQGNDTTVNDEIDNGGNDEDDADIEQLELEIFDLALRKSLAAGEDDRVYPGETITFDIEVFNQGTVAASNIEILDTPPAGLTPVGTTTLIIPGPIAPGSSELVQISMIVDANASAGFGDNIAEIQSAEDPNGDNPVDNDSTPDSNPNNDPTTDDEINNGSGDEDDNDLETVDIQIFDLALIKVLAAGEDDRVYPGETITFTIEVFNQGTVPASNINIEDYVPTGLTANGATSLNIAGPIAPGASATVDISFTVSANTSGQIINLAEIASAEDDLGENPADIDSTPDTNDGNDAGGVVNGPSDDQTDGNGTDDEDDADPEDVFVEIFDLASNITLAPGEDDRVYPGETVSFKVTVFNQGTVTAEDVEVTLMIPAELQSVAGIPNMGTITFPGPIAPGAMEMQIIDFVVDANATSASELIIKEEISDYVDDLGNMPTDIDSTPDADFTNDAGGVVDGATDDTIDNEGGDEDDADPENVFLEIYDLALRKTLAAGEDATVYPGDVVTFTIEVFNQGTVPASNVVVEDYVPTGLTIVGSSTLTLAGPIAPGSSASVDVSFIVDDANAATTLENGAEIQSSEDDLGENPNDIDSTEDNDPNNDTTEDNEIDNGSGDEDDDDIEQVQLEIFDLALRKTLAAGEDDRVYPGETITFTIEVFNQGTVAASNIVIED